MPLVGSPFPTLIIIFMYLILVIQIGPMFMSKREAIYPRNWIMGYNAYQICANAYICYSVSVNLNVFG